MDIQEVIRQGSLPWWATEWVSLIIWGLGLLIAALAWAVCATDMDDAYEPAKLARKIALFIILGSVILAVGVSAFGVSVFQIPQKTQHWMENYAKPYVESLPWTSVQAEGADIEEDLGEGLFRGTVHFKDERGFQEEIRGTFRAQKTENGQSELKFKDLKTDLGKGRYALKAGKYMAEISYSFTPVLKKTSSSQQEEMLQFQYPKTADKALFSVVVILATIVTGGGAYSVRAAYRKRLREMDDAQARRIRIVGDEMSYPIGTEFAPADLAPEPKEEEKSEKKGNAAKRRMRI